MNANLEGKWFLTPGEDREAECQGEVICAVGEDMFLVQLHSWFDGSPTLMALYALSDMLDWLFFDTPAALGNFLEHVGHPMAHKYREDREPSEVSNPNSESIRRPPRLVTLPPTGEAP